MRKNPNLALATTLIALAIASSAVEARQRPNFAGADTNGDGLISQAELGVLTGATGEDARNLFTRLDRSGDGYIDREEFNEARARRDLRQQRPRLAQLDTDGDHLISKAEFVAKTGRSGRDPERIFAWLDLDGDGYLSENELIRARQKRNANR